MDHRAYPYVGPEDLHSGDGREGGGGCAGITNSTLINPQEARRFSPVMIHAAMPRSPRIWYAVVWQVQQSRLFSKTQNMFFFCSLSRPWVFEASARCTLRGQCRFREFCGIRSMTPENLFGNAGHRQDLASCQELDATRACGGLERCPLATPAARVGTALSAGLETVAAPASDKNVLHDELL